MKLLYVLSRYPNLTETFIAREIDEVIKAGNQVTICILQPKILKLSKSRAIRVKGATEIRLCFNVFKLSISFFSVFVSSPLKVTKIFIEFFVSALRTPRRAHHLLYIFFAVMWFSNQNALKNFQYIHCHFLHVASIASRWMSILLDIPYGITNHVAITRFDQTHTNKLVKDASLCIADTQQIIEHFSNLGVLDVNLIRNGIRCDIPKIKSLQKKDTFVIIGVGSLQYTKGFHILIEAFALLKKNGEQFKGLIIGDGEERNNLQSMITKNDLSELVELKGALSIEDLYAQYNKADLLVMPSIPASYASDGLPTVILEAMLHNLPVIGTDHAAIPEIVINGETGLLVQPNRPDQIYSAIHKIKKNTKLRIEISNNAREIILNQFNIKNNIGLFLDLVSKSINNT